MPVITEKLQVQKIWIIAVYLFVVATLHAQESGRKTKLPEDKVGFIEHKTVAGETLYSIGKKYKVPIQEITGNNPSAVPVLKTGDILRIPVRQGYISAVTDSVGVQPVRVIRHTVARKETLYKISREYGIAVETIKEYNPGLTLLKKGDVILIPRWDKGSVQSEKPAKEDVVLSGSKITHWVQPGETLYSISRRYGQPVASILEMNPSAKELKPGMRLVVLKGRTENIPHQVVDAGTFNHEIQAGETLYSVSRKYNISPEMVLEANPSLNQAFPAGSVIRIPVTDKGMVIPARTERTGSGIHVVKKGETLYGLSQLYKIPMSEILRENPFLANQPPRPGDTLRISVAAREADSLPGNTTVAAKPGSDVKSSVDYAPADCVASGTYGNDQAEIKVALLIPAFLESNSQMNESLPADWQVITEEELKEDIMQEKKPVKSSDAIQFYGSSENFIHFYEGVLLAVDSLQQMGIRVELNVFDTEQKASKVKTLVHSGKLDRMDLIIGPVFPGEQKEIADFAQKNQVPVVTPLSSSDEVTRTNPWFFQVNPPREVIRKITGEYIASNYRNENILILQTGNAENLAEEELAFLENEMKVQGEMDKAPGISICNFKKDGYAALRDALKKECRNILVIPSMNEVDVSPVVSDIRPLAGEFEIILIGTNKFSQFESINPEQYHYGQLEFLTPYWPDFTQEVARSFAVNFRNQFRTEPNQYSIQGYDVAFFFIKAYRDFGSGLRNCISHASCSLVQGDYSFIPLPSGGYINEGMYVVRYTPDFHIERKMVFKGRSLSGNPR
jgi:LysM repeat protein